MKTWIPLLAVATISLLASEALSQTVPANPLVPKTSGGSKTRNLGGGGDLGAGVSVPKKQTVIVQHVAVTPVRGWTNTGGKTIQARLLAFSAPKQGESGPVEVIREGKIRFLVPGRPQPMDYPIEQLQAEDRAEVERIAKAAAGGPPPEEEPGAENAEAKPDNPEAE